MSSSFNGAGYVLTGLRWLPKSGLRGFVAMPLLINTLLFGAGLWWSTGSSNGSIKRGSAGCRTGWLAALAVVAAVRPDRAGGGVLHLFRGGERARRAVQRPAGRARSKKWPPAGPATPPTAELTWQELLLSPLTELNKLLYFVGWAIPLLVLSFVPVINVAAPVLWALVHRLDAGAGICRLSARQPGAVVPGPARLLRKHWPLTLGFGGMALLLTLIPVLNFSGHAGGGDRRDPDVEMREASDGNRMTGATSSRPEALMRGLYTGLLYLLLPLALLRLYWRGRRDPDIASAGASGSASCQRLPEPGCLWIHAVSVGEARAALPLIRALLDRYPEIAAAGDDHHPDRFPSSPGGAGRTVSNTSTRRTTCPMRVRRFLRRTRPRMAVIMETELWPNVLRRCARAGIPVLIANARLSERSARGYAGFGRLTACHAARHHADRCAGRG
jgi:CysZ protein